MSRATEGRLDILARVAAPGHPTLALALAVGVLSAAGPSLAAPQRFTRSIDLALEGTPESNVTIQTGRVHRSRIAGSLGAFVDAGTLPAPRAEHGAAVVGDHLYLVGGVGESGESLASVVVAELRAWRASGRLDAWRDAEALPAPRRGLALVRVDARLYAVGGCGADACSPSDATDEVLVSTARADGGLDPWRLAGRLPRPTGRLAAVAADGWLYVVGGRSGSVWSEVHRAALRADGTLADWTREVELPQARERHGLLAHDGHLFVVGGSDGVTAAGEVYRSAVDRTGALGPWGLAGQLSGGPRSGVAVLVAGSLGMALGGDGAAAGTVGASSVGASGQIQPGTLSPLGTPRSGASALAIDGRVLVLGGRSDAGAGTALDVVAAPLRPATEALASGLVPHVALAPLPSAVLSHAALGVGGHVYLLGGCKQTISGLGCVQPSNEVLVAEEQDDGGLSTFRAVASFAGPRSGFAAAAWREVIYVGAGGFDGGSLDDLQATRVLTDGDLSPWARVSRLPEPLRYPGLVAANGRLFVVGGNSGSNDLPTAAVWSAALLHDGGLAPWQPEPALPTPTSAQTVEVYGGRLYNVGGEGPAGMLTDVISAALLADGGLGPWTPTTPLPDPLQGHAGGAAHGLLFVAGGYEYSHKYYDEVRAAPVLADGGVGDWMTVGRIRPGRDALRSAVGRRGLYVMGGISDGQTARSELELVAFAAPAARGVFSTTIDLGPAAALRALTLDATLAPGAALRLALQTAGADGAFGAWRDVGELEPNQPFALDGAVAHAVRLRVELDDSRSAASLAGDPCTSTLDAIAVEYEANPSDGGSASDAGGVADGGTPVPRPPLRLALGCDCQTAGAAPGLLALFVTVIAARRLRSRSFRPLPRGTYTPCWRSTRGR